MTIKRVAPPPSDEQLAAVERTEIVRRRDREAEIEDEQEQDRLAAAGEPESEAKRALRAGASVLNSRPNRAEGPTDDDNDDRATSLASGVEKDVTTKTRKRRKDQRSDRSNGERASRRTSIEIPPAPQAQELDPEEAQAKQAYDLMDLAFRKWAKHAPKDLRKANRDLALDLGKDTVIYLQRGIIRLNDWGDYLNKLTATKTGEREPDSDGEDFDTELETMRAALRNEK